MLKPTRNPAPKKSLVSVTWTRTEKLAPLLAPPMLIVLAPGLALAGVKVAISGRCTLPPPPPPPPPQAGMRAPSAMITATQTSR